MSFEGFPIAVEPPKAILDMTFLGSAPILVELIVIFPAELVDGTARQAQPLGEHVSDGRFTTANRSDQDDLKFCRLEDISRFGFRNLIHMLHHSWKLI